MRLLSPARPLGIRFTARMSFAVSALALGLTLSACDRPDAPAAPAEAAGESHPGFARDMIALKASGLGGAEREAAVRALLARYGKVVAAPSDGDLSKLPSPEAAEGAQGPAESEGRADLAKAAVAVLRWKLVKISTLEFPFVLRLNATVPAGKTLSASTAIGAGAEFTDPFLVAFYQSGGAFGAKAYPIKVVGFNDDSNGGLNASFSWTNNTGASQFVQVICFAYSPETAGPMKLFVTRPGPGGIGSVTETAALLNVSGLAKYNDEAGPFQGCVRSTGSRISLRPLRGFFTDHSMLAVNASSLTGGFIRRDVATLDLDRNLPSGYPNLVLGYIPWAGAEGDGETQYSAGQDNLYSCAQ